MISVPARHPPRSSGTYRFDPNRCLVNGAGWVLYRATSISDRGQIVGTGSLLWRRDPMSEEFRLTEEERG
jgi:hypothetical protein